jgi:2-polyprenyl-6-methoxyphenol hydroxylase-like FAD-dependent oxidoreductase
VAEGAVAVVGGGPAGYATAIACATAGLRVTVIERAPFPRDRPGETLHPGVEPLLVQLGVAEEVRSAGFLRHEGHWVRWGGAARFERFGGDAGGPWRGFQAWRADFDAILERRARALGVEVRRAAARAPLHAQGRVAGVVTSSGRIDAAVTVDAAGGGHWLARALDVEIDAVGPRRIAWYGYAEGDAADCDRAPRLVGNATGWTWRARVRPGLYHWTRLARRATGRVARPRALAHLAPRGPIRGADVTWRRARRIAGPGWFLAGDAATVLDPAAAQGVLRALASGLLVAHCIAAVRAGTISERRAAGAYDAWVGRRFGRAVAAMRRLERAAARPPRTGR